MAMVTQMKISRVMLFHNEEEYLRYSLPPLKTIPFDELVFVLDRCTDNSEQVIRNLGLRNSRIVYKREQRWTYNFAETFQTGFDEAQNDFVFAMSADLIITPEASAIAEEVMWNPKVGGIFFGFFLCLIRGCAGEFIWCRGNENLDALLEGTTL